MLQKTEQLRRLSSVFCK